MQLNPRQVEAFRAVMLTGSMTTAPESLRITQPAVSRLIRDLEGELGFRLFRRQGNRLVASYEGTVLFTEVDRFFIGMDKIGKLAADLRNTKAGSLRVASIGALSFSCMPEAIRIFCSERPDVNVMLDSLNSPSVLELVAGRHFDIGFAMVGGDFPGVDLTFLPPVEAVCVAPRDYPMAAAQTVAPEDFEEVPYISLGPNSPLRLKIDQLFDERQVRRTLRIESSIAAGVVELVGSGVGASIIDPFTADAFRAGGRFSILTFRPRLTFEVAVVVPSHVQVSRLSREFAGIVRGIFDRVATQRSLG